MNSPLASFRVRLHRAAVWAIALGWVCAGGVLVSCRTANPAPARPAVTSGPPINGLSIMTMPMAISVVNRDAADGFALKLLASSPGKPKSQPIGQGEVDLFLVDGIVKELPLDSRLCRRVWTFSAPQLIQFRTDSTVGVAYVFALSWAQDPPTDNKVTLFARYRPPKGESIISAPGYLFLAR